LVPLLPPVDGLSFFDPGHCLIVLLSLGRFVELRVAQSDDEKRRRNLHSDGENAYLFQPLVNYRTLEFNKPLSRRMVRNIVARWGNWCGLKRLSPHDLRRTAITRALDQGLSYRQVQMMSGHKDPKTVMRYDHGRENLEQNAVNFLNYDN
jgi:integrase/recombinase XerD